MTWSDKALASAAGMAKVRHQMRRLARGGNPRPGTHPAIALLSEHRKQRASLRGYRAWLSASRTGEGRGAPVQGLGLPREPGAGEPTGFFARSGGRPDRLMRDTAAVGRRRGSEQPMAMVGLFWIAEGDVYVGAKPSGSAPGVRLTPDGVVALGDGQSGLHLWEDVPAPTVRDVPVKSLKRQVGMAADVALDGGDRTGDDPGPGRTGEAPPMMTVELESNDGEHELKAYVAAAVGYSSATRLSFLLLLSRLTEGAATMATTLAAMSEWGRAWEGGSPRTTQREEAAATLGGSGHC
ncbi:hypothetical protein STANM309S_02685 [Streptomyces tanashiensis]